MLETDWEAPDPFLDHLGTIFPPISWATRPGEALHFWVDLVDLQLFIH
jgi:hypothetical protein